jgi:hypothetical protein
MAMFEFCIILSDKAGNCWYQLTSRGCRAACALSQCSFLFMAHELDPNQAI